MRTPTVPKSMPIVQTESAQSGPSPAPVRAGHRWSGRDRCPRGRAGCRAPGRRRGPARAHARRTAGRARRPPERSCGTGRSWPAAGFRSDLSRTSWVGPLIPEHIPRATSSRGYRRSGDRRGPWNQARRSSMKDALAIHRWLLAHQVHHEIVRLPRPMTCVDELPERSPPRPSGAWRSRCSRSPRESAARSSSPSSPPFPTRRSAGAVGGALGVRKVRPAPTFWSTPPPTTRPGSSARCCCPRAWPWLSTTGSAPMPTRSSRATGERHTALSMRALDLLTLLPGKTVNLTCPDGPEDHVRRSRCGTEPVPLRACVVLQLGRTRDP